MARLGAQPIRAVGLWFLVAALYAPALIALPDGPPLMAVRSRTGQFVVHGPPPKDSTLLLPGAKEDQLLELNPALLVVTAERIKGALLTELGLSDEFRATIHLVLGQDPAHPHREVLITSTLYQKGWRYLIQLPREIEAVKLVRAVVAVLLQEIADRASGDRAAEVPLWFKEGLSFHLLNYAALNLTLQTESLIVREGKKPDPFAHLRGLLREKPVLTVQQLSFPKPEELTPNNLPFYQQCAQLFFFELLQLKGGRAALAKTLRSLPRYLNWQFAFLEAFKPHFRDLLGLEKWWALHVVHFTGRTEAQSWLAETTQAKLDDLLRVYPGFTGSDRDPVQYLSLQKIAAQWGFAEQKELFQTKVRELALLRSNVPRDYITLIDAYRAALERYLHKRGRAGFASNRPGHYYGNVPLLLDEFTKEMNDLDKIRSRAASKP